MTYTGEILHGSTRSRGETNSRPATRSAETAETNRCALTSYRGIFGDTQDESGFYWCNSGSSPFSTTLVVSTWLDEQRPYRYSSISLCRCSGVHGDRRPLRYWMPDRGHQTHHQQAAALKLLWAS